MSEKLIWFKSTASASQDSCVEVASLANYGVAVRDSKNKSGPVLHFTAEAWKTFMERIRTES